MPQYTVDTGNNPLYFEASNADEARRSLALTLGENGIDNATLIGPSGQSWRIYHNHEQDGLNGWRSRDASGSVSRIFPVQTPHPGTLWAGGWQGIYKLSNGRYLNAFNSEQFEDGDFALVGAVYYDIYGSDGVIEDGGWYGYSEDMRWSDFLKFAELGSTPRLLAREGDAKYDDIVESIEEGTYGKSESPKPKCNSCKGASRSGRSNSPKKRKPAKRRG